MDVTRLPTTSKVIALTFDGGGNDAGLSSILATLKAEGVPGTFFLTGSWIKVFPGGTRAIDARGYTIGNHTQTHPDLTTMSSDDVRLQVRRMAETLKATVGHRPARVFRFPYGATNSRVIGIVNDEGYVAVRWTVDTLGWKGTSTGQSVASVTARVLEAARPGAIVLMHIGSHPSDRSTLDADALPGVIAALQAKGYRFVGLGSLLP